MQVMKVEQMDIMQTLIKRKIALIDPLKFNHHPR